MVRAVKPPILDALDLEREIEKEFRKLDQHDSLPTEFAPPSVRAPDLGMPDYVEHSDGATEIGKLSAEAVVREYEAAAKDIEALGEELTERAKQCEAMMRDALVVTDELKETAKRYRAEAKRVFDQIESCSLLTAEVRKICEDMKDRLAAPTKVQDKTDA
ncbi:hypothetical protein [Bradyrhizobium sp. BWA-3-5]|uniref:hypothetical protein n=1 Tax=Bradyrhizobium sp. BWA-3-5 TaxID=3080013 RepID=UPI00293E02CC|nr:hypothetical protein [Bradyrhizobium sp. BWA-3-5]WOH69416.1 hypothetical protein RX331_17695 [Bradyrhizobium sp. BWA-3-5]